MLYLCWVQSFVPFPGKQNTSVLEKSQKSDAPFFPIYAGMDGRYSVPCPKCGAVRWSRCNSNGTASRYIHRARTLEPQPKPQPIPSFIYWWRAMRVFEGSHPRKRPPDLVVPSQAELLEAVTA